MMNLRAIFSATALAQCVLLTGWMMPASAGVPFVTDDAGTPERGKFEINLLSLYSHFNGETDGTVYGGEVNYGMTSHIEAHLYVPIAFDQISGKAMNVGIGDVEIGFKYRFLDGTDLDGWDVGTAPMIDVPSGARTHNLGTGSRHAFLPLLVGKTWGKLALFGSAAVAINPGTDNRNWFYSGAGVTYDITPKWTLGSELYYASASVVGNMGGTGFTVGGVYNINETFHVLLSAGRNLTNTNRVNMLSALLGLQITF